MIKIQPMDSETIKVNDLTAYKCDSKKGRTCLKTIRKRLLGKWHWEQYGIMVDTVFTEDKMHYSVDNNKEVCSYEFLDAKIIVTMNIKGSTSPVKDVMYVQVDDKQLYLSEEGQTITWIRETNKIQNKQSQTIDLQGKWISRNKEKSEIVSWKFDTNHNKVTKAPLYKKAKSTKSSYKLIQSEYENKIKIGKKTYSLFFDQDCMILSSDKETFYLYAYDSETAKDLIKRAKVLNSNGQITSRTYTYKNDYERDTFQTVKLVLNCKNNIILEDVISVSTANNRIAINNTLGKASVKADLKYRSAKLCFYYRNELLQHNCVTDLRIGYDRGTGLRILDTKLNQKANTLSVPYQGDGDYYIVDCTLYENGKQVNKKKNVYAAAWACTDLTGDILKLVDFDYMEQSKKYFKVTTPAQLASAVYFVNTQSGDVTIELLKDIDLSEYNWASMGWSDGYHSFSFSGTILGNNHKITGLHMEGDGLIAWETGCYVKDLTIEDARIHGKRFIAVLTGQAIGGYYNNCKVSGTVTSEYGDSGSQLGHAAEVSIANCTADVVVDGEKFKFLTYNEKAISEIKIENPIKITLSKDYTITREESSGYTNFKWVLKRDGRKIEECSADNRLTYQYSNSFPGEYECYLCAYVSGQYVPVSNIVKYTIR